MKPPRTFRGRVGAYIALTTGVLATSAAALTIQDLCPGAPRPWERGLQISSYSMVNLANGNVLTTIPIIGWSGRGPDVDFSMYHNSADDTWRMSYGSTLVEVTPDEAMTLIQDDGRSVEFTYDVDHWDAEAGYAHLMLKEGVDEWSITTRSRWVLTFDASGNSPFPLESIIDGLV